MDAPEGSGNRIGRTIWTVWGYLSGAVARYLRPEVTDEGNQSVRTRADDIVLKSAANQINRDVKANDTEKEEKKFNQNDESTAEVKCSPPEVRVQVASVQWENTDVVKDDKNVELHVDTATKPTFHCAMWSTETGHEGSISGDSESQGCKSGMHVDKEAVSSDEVLAERVNASCKESVTVQELDKTGQIEGKKGDNEESDHIISPECETTEADGHHEHQTFAGTDHGGSISCDTERDTRVENEAVLSNEGQAKRVYANSECKESETALELDETGNPNQKHEDEKCSNKTEDPDDADATVQCELYGQDVEQEIMINMMDRGETESIGGFKHADEHLIDEMEKNIVGLKDLEKTETHEDQRSQSQVQDLLPELDYSTEETGSEQDTTKSELLESVETQHRVSKEISEKNVSNNETELKMTSVFDEDILLLDSKQDTLENTSETGTGSPEVAIKTEGMFSGLIVCEFPGESRKGPETALRETSLGCFEVVKTNQHELQSLAEEQIGTETFVACSVEHPEKQKAVEEAVEIEQHIETPIESLDATESLTHQELDKTKFSLKEQVELRTELIVETTEIKTSSEDEEAESLETQSERNVTLQTHELLEFKERECKSSQETIDTFSESLGNSSISEITGPVKIEHVAEDQTNVRPVLTRTLSPAESLEETLDLQSESDRCIEEQEPLDTDLRKSALEYVEEITNQVLKEMIETEMVQETETLVGFSTEELGDAEYQEPEECVSAGAVVLEEEMKLLGETMGSMVEMEMETAIREVAKQNELHIFSPECETTEADGHHEHQTFDGTDHGGSISCDTKSDAHVENEAVSSDEGQAERVYANSECKESETAIELDETGQTEQKDGNDDECDQNHEDEKCERKKEDADNTDATVQYELYGQDVEQELVINMMDSGETDSIGGFRHADEHLDEKEKNIVEQHAHEKTEIEDKGPELQVPDDAFILEEGSIFLDETMDSKIELEVENASSEAGKQNEQHIISPECETTEADEHHEHQTYLGAGTDHGGSISCDTESDAHVENEAVSSDEGQAERVYANSECKESETAIELDETGQTEQKDGNDDECDQNHEDEKCERKKEDADNTDTTVQYELYGQGVEQELVINMMDSGETDSIGGFRHADEHLLDEKEKNIFDQNVHEKEVERGPELQVPDDAFVLEEGSKLLGETMDSKIELEVENASSEAGKQNEPHIISPECETTEADGHHEHQTYLGAGTDHGGSISCDTERDTHVENEAVSSDEGQAERVYANSECKESETAIELDETGQTEQKDGNDDECDQNHEDEKCERKKEDADNTDATVQSELYGQDVEQELVINMMDSGETESIGGFRHADEHLLDEKEKNIVEQHAHEKTEIEDKGPELQVPDDAFVLEEGSKLLGETMDSKIELEVENASSEAGKQNEPHIISPECETTEADEHHEQQTFDGTDHGGSISCDTERDTHVENEAVSSDEGQAERVYANSECKESETALELDEAGQIEQKDGNDEECDQKHEDEKCERKREDADNTDATVQSELYGKDVEQQIENMDHGETESIGGFRHADEKETNIFDQNVHEKEVERGPELQVPDDAFVLEEGRKLLGETMDRKIELEVENASSEVGKQNELQSSPECETTEADGRHEQIQKVIAGETELRSHDEDLMEISRPGMKRGFDRVSKDLPVAKTDLDLQTFEDSSLDFTVQKSRIAVKNPLVRPPKDPRKLLYMISVEPLAPQPPACAQKAGVSAPSKGLVGFKLPGLGPGLPALRKTEFGKKAREGGDAEHTLHPQQKAVAVTEDSVKQEQASAKPKWTPPKHPGMGGPLMMAELKNKLKKPKE